MKKELIMVTGYFGAPVEETARKLAADKAFAYLSLDEEIVLRDGRSIGRLSMMAGEHGYRNQEYEILSEIDEDPEKFFASKDIPAETKGLVIACSDGVLYDEMSRDIALANKLIVTGEDMTGDALWENARTISGTYHAFMHFGTDEERRQAFDNYIDRQRLLFDSVKQPAERSRRSK